MARPVQQIKSHPTGGGGGLLLAPGLVTKMRAGHASTERFSIHQPAKGQGAGHKQPGWELGEAAPKPKETGPRERQTL